MTIDREAFEALRRGQGIRDASGKYWHVVENVAAHLAEQGKPKRRRVMLRPAGSMHPQMFLFDERAGIVHPDGTPAPFLNSPEAEIREQM